jgi:hypothetical protein
VTPGVSTKLDFLDCLPFFDPHLRRGGSIQQVECSVARNIHRR